MVIEFKDEGLGLPKLGHNHAQSLVWAPLALILTSSCVLIPAPALVLLDFDPLAGCRRLCRFWAVSCNLCFRWLPNNLSSSQLWPKLLHQAWGELAGLRWMKSASGHLELPSNLPTCQSRVPPSKIHQEKV